MNEETPTSGLQTPPFMNAIYPIVVPAAIAAMTAGSVTYDGRRDQHDAELYLPVSSAPEQPHQHGEKNNPVETTRVEWSVSGTNTSAALANTTWTSTTLVMPHGSDPNVVSRLEHAGLLVVVDVFPATGVRKSDYDR
jgi:hypothetical protein